MNDDGFRNFQTEKSRKRRKDLWFDILKNKNRFNIIYKIHIFEKQRKEIFKLDIYLYCLLNKWCEKFQDFFALLFKDMNFIL